MTLTQGHIRVDLEIDLLHMTCELWLGLNLQTGHICDQYGSLLFFMNDFKIIFCAKTDAVWNGKTVECILCFPLNKIIHSLVISNVNILLLSTFQKYK